MNFDRTKYLPVGNGKCHLAIIPDGARRWAKINSLGLDESYAVSVKNIVKLTSFFF